MTPSDHPSLRAHVEGKSQKPGIGLTQRRHFAHARASRAPRPPTRVCAARLDSLQYTKRHVPLPECSGSRLGERGEKLERSPKLTCVQFARVRELPILVIG